MRLSKQCRVWLWLSVVLAAAGGLMLYPIGPAVGNMLFVLIKIGMVYGLLLLLFPGKRPGFALWATCSAAAVIMTLVKWSLSGGSFLLAASMVVDVCMPLVAWRLLKAA